MYVWRACATVNPTPGPLPKASERGSVLIALNI